MTLELQSVAIGCCTGVLIQGLVAIVRASIEQGKLVAVIREQISVLGKKIDSLETAVRESACRVTNSRCVEESRQLQLVHTGGKHGNEPS